MLQYFGDRRGVNGWNVDTAQVRRCAAALLAFLSFKLQVLIAGIVFGVPLCLEMLLAVEEMVLWARDAACREKIVYTEFPFNVEQ